jgi:hypothetical protein
MNAPRSFSFSRGDLMFLFGVFAAVVVIVAVATAWVVMFNRLGGCMR